MGVDEYVLQKRLKAAGVGRFQVMALLQAARYHVLYGDINMAKSFGLNRAIFYAWAKYYGPSRPAYLRRITARATGHKGGAGGAGKCPEGFELVAGECVQKSGRGFFVIGDKEQDPRDFDSRILGKIRIFIDPDKAWREALEYVSKFPRSVLEDPQKFYKYVYEPVRDSFLADLVLGRKPQPNKQVIERLRSLDETARKASRGGSGSQRSILDYGGGSG